MHPIKRPHSSGYILPIMRISTLILCLVTLVGFGYALSGLAGYLLGKGSPSLIVKGSLLGIVTSWLSLHLWKRYLALLAETPEDK